MSSFSSYSSLMGYSTTDGEQRKEEIKYNSEAFKKQFGRSPGEPRRIVVLDKPSYPESIDLEKISDYDGFSGFPLIAVAATQVGGKIETLQVSNLSGISVVIQASSVPALNVACWSELVAMLMNPAVLKFGQPISEHITLIRKSYGIEIAGWYNLEYLFNSDLDDISSSLHKTLADYSQRLFDIEPPEQLPPQYFKPSAPEGLSESDVRAAKRTQIALDVAAFQLLKITLTRDPVVWGYHLVPKIPRDVSGDLKAEKFENFVERGVVGDYSRSAAVSQYWRGNFISAGQTMQKFWLICTEARKRMFQSRPEGPNSTINHADMVRYLAGRLKKLRSDCGTDVASEEDRKNWLTLEHFMELTEDFAAPPSPLYDWTNDENDVFSCVCTIGFDSIIYRQTVKESVPVGKGDVIDKANASALAAQTWALMFLDEVESFLEDLRNSDLAGVPRLGVPPETTVFIGNISPYCSNELILNVLRLMGSVISWDRAKGNEGEPYRKFGFCKYKHPNVTLRAVRILDGFQIGDDKLTVKVDEKMQKVLLRWDEKMRTAKRRGARSQKSQEVLDVPFRKATEDLVKHNFPSPGNETFAPISEKAAKARAEFAAEAEQYSNTAPTPYYMHPMYAPMMHPQWYPGMVRPPWPIPRGPMPPHMRGVRPSYRNVPPPVPFVPASTTPEVKKTVSSNTIAKSSPTTYSAPPLPTPVLKTSAEKTSERSSAQSQAQAIPNFLRSQLQGKTGSSDPESGDMKKFLSAEIDRWKAKHAAREEVYRAPRCPEGATPKQVTLRVSATTSATASRSPKEGSRTNSSSSSTKSHSSSNSKHSAKSTSNSDTAKSSSSSKRSNESNISQNKAKIPKTDEVVKRKPDHPTQESKEINERKRKTAPVKKPEKLKTEEKSGNVVETKVENISTGNSKKLELKGGPVSTQPKGDAANELNLKDKALVETAKLKEGQGQEDGDTPKKNIGEETESKHESNNSTCSTSWQNERTDGETNLENKESSKIELASNDDDKYQDPDDIASIDVAAVKADKISDPASTDQGDSTAMMLRFKNAIDDILRSDPAEIEEPTSQGASAVEENKSTLPAESISQPETGEKPAEEITDLNQKTNFPVVASMAHHNLFETSNGEIQNDEGEDEICAAVITMSPPPNVSGKDIITDNESEESKPEQNKQSSTEGEMPILELDSVNLNAEKQSTPDTNLTPSEGSEQKAISCGLENISRENNQAKAPSPTANRENKVIEEPAMISPKDLKEDSESTSSSVKSLIIELLTDARGSGHSTANAFWGEHNLEYDASENESYSTAPTVSGGFSLVKKSSYVQLGSGQEASFSTLPNDGSKNVYEVLEVIQNAILVRKVSAVEKPISGAEEQSNSRNVEQPGTSKVIHTWLPTKTVIPVDKGAVSAP